MYIPGVIIKNNLSMEEIDMLTDTCILLILTAVVYIHRAKVIPSL